jgi:Family of unknown function (DUF6011)
MTNPTTNQEGNAMINLEDADFSLLLEAEPVVTATVPTASPKQRKFILDLLAEREVKGTAYEGWTPDWSKSTVTSARKVIDFLMTLPRAEIAGLEDAPRHMRYALRDEFGVVKFYQVDRPTEGKYAGWTFLDAVASDDTYPIKGASKRAILARIAADPEAAMRLYGAEIGRCGHCGRTLTSEWRLRGIGPKCAAKLGW